MGFDFRGKKAVITGGSRGIGRSIALEFAKAGAFVSICARGEAGLASAKKDIEVHRGEVHAGRCDLADADSIARHIAEAGKALGGIDILVNNASGYGMSEEDEGNWAACIAVDLLASVRASRAAQRFIEKSGAGSIVNISSISGMHATAGDPPYGAVKAALFQFTTSQAVALAPKGIRVNCVAPGSIEFPDGYWDKVKKNDRMQYDKTMARIPFGRHGRPEEVAQAVLFLASPMASWITGQTIVTDGGQSLH
jgi:NAD(P)-dependent dehydrogenase (short-subunit alcohol dehydrogenase family)